MSCQNVYLDDIKARFELCYVVSKTRSLGQMIEKPCKYSRGHNFASIFIMCVKMCLLMIEFGECGFKYKVTRSNN